MQTPGGAFGEHTVGGLTGSNSAEKQRGQDGSGRKGYGGAWPRQPGGAPEQGGVVRKDQIWDPAASGPHTEDWLWPGECILWERQLSRDKAARFNTAAPLSDLEWTRSDPDGPRNFSESPFLLL